MRTSAPAASLTARCQRIHFVMSSPVVKTLPEASIAAGVSHSGASLPSRSMPVMARGICASESFVAVSSMPSGAATRSWSSVA